MSASEPAAFQDLIGAENHCHGCGPENEKGLRIKSFFDGEEGICRFQPKPHHCAGSQKVVNGGILASVIDCHSVHLAMADAYLREGRPVGSDPKIWYVTGQLNVAFKKPTPIAEELLLRSTITKREGRKSWLTCALSAAGLVTVEADVLAVQVRRLD